MINGCAVYHPPRDPHPDIAPVRRPTPWPTRSDHAKEHQPWTSMGRTRSTMIQLANDAHASW